MALEYQTFLLPDREFERISEQRSWHQNPTDIKQWVPYESRNDKSCDIGEE